MFPSLNSLLPLVDNDPARALILREVLAGRRDPAADPDRFPETCAWIRACYHTPEYQDVHRAGVEIRLSAASELIGGYGQETINGRPRYRDRYWGDCVLAYVNMGDPYALTLLYDTDSGTYRVRCWGDYAERDRRLQEPGGRN
jgi:hypothetical protein